MRLRWTYMACLLLVLCILAACGDSGSSVNPEPTPLPTPTPEPTPVPTPIPLIDPVPDYTPTPVDGLPRTVIIYMAGDNSLSFLLKTDASSGDFKELIEGASRLDASVLSANNVLVFADTRDAGFLPSIWRLTQTPEGTGKLKLVKEFDAEVASTDPAVIQEVVSFAVTNYPASSYGFVYWSHGEGWKPAHIKAMRTTNPLRFIGIDDQNDTLKDDSRIITEVADLAKVLQTVGQTFDFLMFDACYMLSMEALYELRHCAKYIIASPTETPGPGAPYDTLLGAMLAPDGSVIGMGDRFYSYYSQLYDGSNNSVPSADKWHGGVTVGVVDCGQLETLAKATSQCLNGVSHPDNKALREAVFTYDRRSLVNQHYYFDTVDLMKTIMEDDAFAVWQKAYQNALVSWNATPKYYASASRWFSMETAHGITHYIPKTNDISEALDIAYRSTAWYKDAGLSQLGW